MVARKNIFVSQLIHLATYCYSHLIVTVNERIQEPWLEKGIVKRKLDLLGVKFWTTPLDKSLRPAKVLA